MLLLLQQGIVIVYKVAIDLDTLNGNVSFSNNALHLYQTMQLISTQSMLCYVTADKFAASLQNKAHGRLHDAQVITC